MMTQANATRPLAYAVITTAYNAGKHIRGVIESILIQERRPIKWIIVSDGSTDDTAAIVREYAGALPFLELLEIDQHASHDFASKVRAFRVGAERLKSASFDLLANLDADVSFGPSYFSGVISAFEADDRLGIAGGAIWEFNGDVYAPRPYNTATDVAGAVQVFRKECYVAVGGFPSLRYGGEDWAAQIAARMAGWEVRTLPGLQVLHHGVTVGTAAAVRRGFLCGRMDQAVGSHPLFELVRLARRTRPGVEALVSLARLLGFAWGYLNREERTMPPEFVAFLRAYESRKMRVRLAQVLGRVPRAVTQ